MIVLGIESTCDETGFALVKDGKIILSNQVASQIQTHSPFGGVVPELASRKHVEMIPFLLKKALKESDISLKEVDLIAVAMGPGLLGPLLIGMNTAKTLSLALKIPFVGVNHIEAHLFAALMSAANPPPLPALGLVVSGGHSSLFKIEKIGDYSIIGSTQDDAIGEAFDKAASLLSLPYPGGPAIEKLAKAGNPQAYPFKAGHIKDRPLDFSFSGLKTSILYTVKGVGGKKGDAPILPQECFADVAASFQEAAFADVILKLKKGKEHIGAQSLIFGGGVTNNRTLREKVADAFPDTPAFWPDFSMTLDNAAMIAGLGTYVYQAKGRSDPFTLMPKTRFI